MTEHEIETDLERKLSTFTRALVRGDIDQRTYDDLADQALAWADDAIADLRPSNADYTRDHAADYRKHDR